MSDRKWSDFQRPRVGWMVSSSPGPSFCASIAPQHLTVGASCRAAFAEFPIDRTHARSRWATASNRPMCGCSRKAPSKSPAFCPRLKAFELPACWEICQVGQRTICSGSAVTSSGLRRRFVWCVALPPAQLTRMPLFALAGNPWNNSWRCSSDGALSGQRHWRRDRLKPAIKACETLPVMDLRCRLLAQRDRLHPSSARD